MPAISSASYSNTTQMFRLCMRSWKIVVRHDRVELEATAHKVKSWALTLRVTRYHLNAEFQAQIHWLKSFDCSRELEYCRYRVGGLI